MAEVVPGWTPEAERSFKEVLFRFLEEVHCTKAALYLLGPEHRFVLVAQYGFGRRDRLAIAHQLQDPIPVKVSQLRNRPTAINHPGELPEIGDYLRASGSSRALLVPLFGTSRVIGFVDARDKGGQRPFENVDLRQGAVIGGAFLDLIRRHSLSPDLAAGEAEDAAGAASQARAGLAPPDADVQLDQSALEDLTEAAAESVAREEAFAVALTVAQADAAATLVYTGVRAQDLDSDALTRHQAEALARAKVVTPHHTAWRLDARRVPVGGERLRPSLVATELPLRCNGWSLVISVVGAEGGASPATVLERLRRVAVTAHELTALRFSRRGLARRLLEPGELRYPDLVAHSLAVSRMCWLMAQALELNQRGSEEALLAGLLHDVGMRELEYGRLYRHRAPAPDDRRIYRQHVVVGERILRGTGLEGIARAVRHHHERWDGQGYPDNLAGESIPVLARLVHVAEVYDTLTSPSSYRTPVPPEHALSTLRAGSGQQFDASLVQVLLQVVR